MRPKRRRGRPPVIDRDAIVSAARGGAEREWTMQSVAESLGVTVQALYRYFPSRQSLVESVVAEVVQDLDVPDVVGAGWRAWLRIMATDLFELLLAHPAATDPAAWDGGGIAAVRLMEQAVTVLNESGFTIDEALDVYVLVAGLAVHNAQEAHAISVRAHQRRQQVHEWLAGAGVELAPLWRRLSRVLVDYDPRESFARQLTWVLDGLPEP